MSDLAWPLIGHHAAEQEAAAALRDGRLHHAWLLQGPSGVGKSRFAKRFAARLLGARGGKGDRAFDASLNDPVVEKILAGSHPDLRWLEREPGDKGKMPLFISVDRIRAEVVNFVSLRPALGGRRICVIDSMDELNTSGSNALLKSLEEPPADCVLLLIHHGQTPLLPTIRSRCRVLRFSPLTDAEVASVFQTVEQQPDESAIRLAGGRPGRAITLSEPDAVAGIGAAKDFASLLGARGRGNVAGIHRNASASDTAFEAFSQALMAWAAREAEKSEDHADAWLWMSRSLDVSRRDAMDRGQTAAKLMTGLQQRLASA